MNVSSASPESASEWVVLAHLLRPQGRKGEILADLLTDFPETLAARVGLRLRRSDGSSEAVGVESSFLPTGRNAGRIVLKLGGVETIEDAELLAGSDLVVAASERIALDDDAAYVADLVGCMLFDQASEVGMIEDVQFPTNATGVRLDEAAPLLIVRAEAGDELLVPFIKAWTDGVDLPGKRLTMRLPKGLLEINRAERADAAQKR